MLRPVFRGFRPWVQVSLVANRKEFALEASPLHIHGTRGEGGLQQSGSGDPNSFAGSERAMPVAAKRYSTSRSDELSRLVRAGLLTGLTDGLFSSVLAVAFYQSTVIRLFQGVASTVLGKTAFDGGAGTAWIGIVMHFGVAFGWSAVFMLFILQSRWIRRILATPYGEVKVAALYGPFIWLVMSLVVIPLLAHRPPTIGVRWWVQLIGHFPFVGLPIVATIGRGLSRSGR
ncbi:MAG: hypothetical protein ABI647_02190 [Gemmatimonadota bacterium]